MKQKEAFIFMMVFSTSKQNITESTASEILLESQMVHWKHLSKHSHPHYDHHYYRGSLMITHA